MSQDDYRLLREFVRRVTINDGSRFTRVTAQPGPEPQCDISYPGHARVGRELAAELGGTLQQVKPAGGERSVRITFGSDDAPTEEAVLAAAKSVMNCDEITSVGMSVDSMHSDKFMTVKLQLPDTPGGRHPSRLGVVLRSVKTKAPKSEGGTAGPGENELIAALNEAGASDDNPVTLDLGGHTFKKVTGAIKPGTPPAGGEPKTDVLLTTVGGNAHPKGALSLKLAAGAPTYGGWSRYAEHLPGAVAELEKFVDGIIANAALEELPDQPGVYEYPGKNFSAPVSDEVADFALYGNEKTSGSAQYGAPKVNHVVTVSSVNFTVNPDGSVSMPGYKVYDEGDYFRGTNWEPYWLYRGATDGRKSGPPGKKLQGRIAIAPGKRARQYEMPAGRVRPKPGRSKAVRRTPPPKK